MDTREGIYIGGHEIIQRYIGSRLVWEKWKLEEMGTMRTQFLLNNSNEIIVEVPSYYAELYSSQRKTTGFWKTIDSGAHQFYFDLDGRGIKFDAIDINRDRHSFKMKLRTTTDLDWIISRWSLEANRTITKDIIIYKKKEV